MISTSRVDIGYGTRRAPRVLLSNLNVELTEGLTALLGANGRGKSTLMRTLSGLQQPLQGEITIDGKPLESMSATEIARKVSIVTGGAPGAGAFTVEELVALGRQPHTGFFGRLHSDDRRMVEEAIALTGIESLRQRHISTLSDGERQKAMIAKALAQNSPVILLDEPTAYLDAATRIELLALLRELSRPGQGRYILMSTHDIAPAVNAADNLWLMTPTAENQYAECRLQSGPTASLIAEGKMNCLFPDRNLHFDSHISDFRISK